MKTLSALEQNILDKTLEIGGKASFQLFMDAALYTPQLGYYQSTLPKFGAAGDFITAPHISPIFAQCLANVCMRTLTDINQKIILELGAGDGTLAIDLLKALKAKEQLPEAYWILETSGFLKHEQQAKLKAALPDYFEHIVWLSEIPPVFKGILIANEVLDALSVARFRLHPETGEIEEQCVEYKNEEWQFCYQPPETPHLKESVEEMMAQLAQPLPKGYVSEMNTILSYFIKLFADQLDEGLMIWIDYGFPRREFYHPDRTQGTLMCHHRHTAHDNPLIHIGMQDITAHVDFTQLALNAMDAGLDVLGFTSQANFLIYAGLAELMNADLDLKAQLQQSQAIQTLTLPHEMGELFKVMILGKNSEPLPDFEPFDQRYRL